MVQSDDLKINDKNINDYFNASTSFSLKLCRTVDSSYGLIHSLTLSIIVIMIFTPHITIEIPLNPFKGLIRGVKPF